MMERRSLLRSAVAGLFPLFFKVVTPAPKPITGVCPKCGCECKKVPMPDHMIVGGMRFKWSEAKHRWENVSIRPAGTIEYVL